MQGRTRSCTRTPADGYDTPSTGDRVTEIGEGYSGLIDHTTSYIGSTGRHGRCLAGN